MFVIWIRYEIRKKPQSFIWQGFSLQRFDEKSEISGAWEKNHLGKQTRTLKEISEKIWTTVTWQSEMDWWRRSELWKLRKHGISSCHPCSLATGRTWWRCSRWGRAPSQWWWNWDDDLYYWGWQLGRATWKKVWDVTWLAARSWRKDFFLSLSPSAHINLSWVISAGLDHR